MRFLIQIGAPPEVISRLDEIREEYNRSHRRHDHEDHDHDPDLDHDDKNHHPLLLMASSAAPTATNSTASAVGDDPELDEFMVIYVRVGHSRTDRKKRDSEMIYRISECDIIF